MGFKGYVLAPAAIVLAFVAVDLWPVVEASGLLLPPQDPAIQQKESEAQMKAQYALMACDEMRSFRQVPEATACYLKLAESSKDIVVRLNVAASLLVLHKQMGPAPSAQQQALTLLNEIETRLKDPEPLPGTALLESFRQSRLLVLAGYADHSGAQRRALLDKVKQLREQAS